MFLRLFHLVRVYYCFCVCYYCVCVVACGPDCLALPPFVVLRMRRLLGRFSWYTAYALYGLELLRALASADLDIVLLVAQFAAKRAPNREVHVVLLGRDVLRLRKDVEARVA